MVVRPEDYITSKGSSGKNALINGNFDFWQRGGSQTETGYGSADRWYCENIGSTKTASRQEFTLGQASVPGNPSYYLRHVVTSVAGASNVCRMVQNVESVKTFADSVVTLSFWAKADSVKSIAVNLSQFFGDGGGSGEVFITPSKLSLTTAWKKYSVNFNLPSISGKTIGTTGNDCVRVGFWFDAGADYNTYTSSLGQQSGTFDIAQVQLEAGRVASEFESRPYAVESLLCQRYYWKGTPISEQEVYESAHAGIQYKRVAYCTFPTTLRKIPVMGIAVAPTYTNCSYLDIVGSASDFMLRVSVTAAGTYSATGGVYWADAEL